VKSKRGFTILEMMVATAVTMVAIVAVFTLIV
jgi:type II secretory pathway component PulJ